MDLKYITYLSYDHKQPSFLWAIYIIGIKHNNTVSSLSRTKCYIDNSIMDTPKDFLHLRFPLSVKTTIWVTKIVEKLTFHTHQVFLNRACIHLIFYGIFNCISELLSYWLPRPRRGLRGIVFTRSVCVCVCVCVCVSVCPANILVFYFSAIRRDIDLKFIQDTYMVVLNSLK